MKILLAFPMNDKQTGLFIKNALAGLGQEVVVVNLNKTFNLMPMVISERPDVIFCSRTPEILPDMMTVKKNFPEIKTACWNVDKRNSVLEFGKPLMQLFDNVDILYTIALGNIDEYKKVCPHASIRHLQQGCDPDVHRTEELTEADHLKYDCDVMFAGGRTNVHKRRDALLKAVGDSKEWSFRQYGNHTGNFITDSEHNKACRCAKIVLGHNAWQDVAISMSVRDYKVMGAGGFLLTEYCKGMEDWYKLGKVCDAYRTQDECMEKIKWYLEHDKERIKIAKAGQRFVHKNHTYSDRMKIVVNDLESLVKTIPVMSVAKVPGKILLGVGEGIGNLVQVLPMVNFAKMQYPGHRFDVMYMEGMQFKFAEYMFKDDPSVDCVFNWTQQVPGRYDGMIISPCTLKQKPQGINCPDLSKFRLNGHSQRMRTSEVTANLLSVTTPKNSTGFGFSPEEIGQIFDFRKYLVKEYVKCMIPKVDVLLHNGYNRNNKIKDLWKVKEYPKFPELVIALKGHGLSVGCIGSNEEYIEGCQDFTGLQFEDTINMVDTCGYFISNDTGTYHICAALGKPGGVLFTAMSHLKNYDKNFHKSIDLIRHDPKCGHHPCQMEPGTFWHNSCPCNQGCRNIDPNLIIEQVIQKLRNET